LQKKFFQKKYQISLFFNLFFLFLLSLRNATQFETTTTTAKMSAPPVKASRELCDAFDLLSDPIKRKAVLDALHYKSMGHAPCRICLCITGVSSDGTCESCAHDAPPSYQQSMESASSASAAATAPSPTAASPASPSAPSAAAHAPAAGAASSASVSASSAAAAAEVLFSAASAAAHPSSGSVVHAPGGPVTHAVAAAASYQAPSVAYSSERQSARDLQKRTRQTKTARTASIFLCASCATPHQVEYNEGYDGWLCRRCESSFNAANDDDSMCERDIPTYTEMQTTDRGNAGFAFACSFCERRVSRFEASIMSYARRKVEVCNSCELL